MRVLFLSVSTGGGHEKAAQALKESLGLFYPGTVSMTVDSLKYINPVFERLLVNSYLATVKEKPQIYKKIFYSSNLNHISSAVNSFFSHKLLKLLKSFKPSIAICTHPFPLQMLSSLKRRHEIDVPVIAVLTDYITHPSWIQDHIDAFIVSHEDMAESLLSKGILPCNIHRFGIPVGQSFLKTKERSGLLKELGLSTKPTVLIMGGSLGLGDIKSAFTALISSRLEIQIIIITGENEKVRKELLQIDHKGKEVKIIGYTNNVSLYMDVSDILITKPGGMTVSEALVKHLPLILISPLPGQEEGNMEFLVREGAAVVANDIKSIKDIVIFLLKNPLKRSLMKEAAKRISRPCAANDTILLAKALVEGEEEKAQ